jgi:hypothetical protein
VRGGAQYRARLNLRPEEAESADSLEARARVYHAAPLREQAFWSATWRERTDWIDQILHRLEERRWPFRTDTGWSSFDLEVLGSRWTRLEFVTVAEANRDRSQTLRAGLRPRWTLTAHALFWGALAAELLLIAVFHVNWRGSWIPVVAQGGIAWWLRHQGRVLQARFSVLLDDVARDWQLTPIRAPIPPPQRELQPAEPPPRPPLTD